MSSCLWDDAFISLLNVKRVRKGFIEKYIYDSYIKYKYINLLLYNIELRKPVL